MKSAMIYSNSFLKKENSFIEFQLIYKKLYIFNEYSESEHSPAPVISSLQSR